MNKLIIILLGFVFIFINSPSKAAISNKINSGDTVFNILQRNKFSTHHLNQAFEKDILPKSFQLIPGQKFYVNNSRGKVFVEFYDNKSDNKFVFWRAGKSAGSRIENTQLRVIEEQVSGKVVGSLLASIMQKIPDKQVAYRFIDAFTYEYNLRKLLKRGARFNLHVEKKYQGKEFIKYGEILFAEIEINGDMVSRHFVSFPDGGAFVDNDWNQNRRPFYSPTSYAKFSSLFTYRRKHPIQGYVKPHLGIDYELPQGANIYAVSSGKILRMGRNRASGNFVVIRHLNGLESYYNHLFKIDSQLRKGGFVAQGQVIGENGCTGYCTKPHLHFAIKQKGRFVDPIKFVKSYPFHRRNFVRKELASNN